LLGKKCYVVVVVVVVVVVFELFLISTVSRLMNIGKTIF